MPITKQKKTEIIEKLKKIFSESPSVAFVQFHKLTVANAQTLRRKLREAGNGYFVAKKTLIRKSLEDGFVKGELPSLDGEVAVAYLEKGADVTAPARESLKSPVLISGIPFSRRRLSDSRSVRKVPL